MTRKQELPRIRRLFKSSMAFSTAAAALIGCLPSASHNVRAEERGSAAQSPAFAPGMINHMQSMRRFPDREHGAQNTPALIPKLELDEDAAGVIGSFQPGGATLTDQNAFFQDLGTNGRTCFTCHQPQSGWTVSAADVKARFQSSSGTDPIFRLVDGATCPSADVSTPAAKRQAYKLLTDKGLIRIGLPMPTPAPTATPPVVLEFEVTSVDDPYHCTTNPATGLTGPTSGIISTYRRPLPSANLGFLSAIMWDGREPNLTSQSIDATLGHAQANAAPTLAQQQQIVAFESGVFTAQSVDDEAGRLNDKNATGGPIALSLQLAKFFIGVNDPLKLNPTHAPFDSNIFDLYKPWASLRGGDEGERRRSIARGEQLFNTTPIAIRGVAGLNDELNAPVINGFCGTCHDTPNSGNHSVKAPLNIGIADAGAKKPPALDISGLPVFTLTCTSGLLAGQVFTVTDPGRATISGKCKDIGRFKGPILRGLASRAPFFHNGSAATLLDAVNFYDQRFAIGFTDRQKDDLVNFLNAL